MTWQPGEDDWDGVQYDTEHADGHLDQFRTARDDRHAEQALTSRARALGLATWNPGPGGRAES